MAKAFFAYLFGEWLVGLEAISLPEDGFYVSLGYWPQLFSQARHMGIDGAIKAIVIIAPEVL